MTRKRIVLAIAALAGACLLGGCSTPTPTAAAAAEPPPAAAASATVRAASDPPRYRCDQGIEFTVRFTDGTATVDAGSRGYDVLLRDAGGATPQQTVYSNARLRAEFGLGVSGREAIVRYAQPPLAAHCLQE